MLLPRLAILVSEPYISLFKIFGLPNATSSIKAFCCLAILIVSDKSIICLLPIALKKFVYLSFILPTIFLDVVVNVVFARADPMSESNILTSADKEFNAPPTVVRSALSLNPPSLLALSGVNPTNEALPAVCISFTAPVIVFEFVFKVVCGRAPMSESNSLIAPTKSESTVVVNLARPPTSIVLY